MSSSDKTSTATACPYEVGQTVQIKDPADLARDLFDMATSPSDPNARLSMELADWFRPGKPLAIIQAVQPDYNGWYLTVNIPSVVGGDDVGLRHTDVEEAAGV